MNCLSFPTLKRLRGLCESLRDDLSIRAILITGAGEKAFCAGADLKERKTMPKERVPDFVRNIRRTMDDVETLPQPTIAVVNGFRVRRRDGAAPRLRPARRGRARRIRTHGDDARDHPRRGRDAAVAAARRPIARQGLDLDGEEDQGARGRADRSREPRRASGELRETALELARQIADNGPVAVRAAKAAIDEGCELPLEKGLEVEARCYERVLPTNDRLEALAAFAEKRKPRYLGS
jgi:enoyl-CoA hydratase/carnithine racemase